jgi:hypothetical protein
MSPSGFGRSLLAVARRYGRGGVCERAHSLALRLSQLARHRERADPSERILPRSRIRN